MSHADHTDGRPTETTTDAAAGDADAPRSVKRVHDDAPISTSWRTVTAPWGTPGDHLTGPIPRIRRRDDGSLTHGEES